MNGQVHVKQVLASVFLGFPGAKTSSSEDFPSCDFVDLLSLLVLFNLLISTFPFYLTCNVPLKLFKTLLETLQRSYLSLQQHT